MGGEGFIPGLVTDLLCDLEEVSLQQLSSYAFCILAIEI